MPKLWPSGASKPAYGATLTSDTSINNANLIGIWLFEDSQCRNWINGTAADQVQGTETDYGYQLNGSSQHLTVTSAITMSDVADHFTMICGVNWEGGDGGGLGAVFNFERAASGPCGTLMIVDSDSKLFFWDGAQTSGRGANVQSGGNRVWSVSNTPTNATCQGYSGTTKEWTNRSLSAATPSTDTNALYFGIGNHGSSNYWFKGTFQFVYLYKTQVADAVVNALATDPSAMFAAATSTPPVHLLRTRQLGLGGLSL